MNDNEIKDLLETIYGIDNVPKAMYGIVASFAQRKSQLRPQPVTFADVAMLTVVYDFMKSMTEEAEEKSNESAEAIAMEEAAKESEGGE